MQNTIYELQLKVEDLQTSVHELENQKQYLEDTDMQLAFGLR